MQKRGSKKAGETVLKPLLWHSVNGTKRWWWVVGGGSSYEPDDSKLVLGAGKHPWYSKLLEFRRERESIEPSGVAQWP